MPGAADAEAATWQRVSGAAGTAPDAFGLRDAHALLARLFPSDDVRAFRARTPRFACSCSRERVAGALKLLGSAEVESILAERGSVGVDCEFCNRRYAFDAGQARALFAPAPAPAVH